MGTAAARRFYLGLVVLALTAGLVVWSVGHSLASRGESDRLIVDVCECVRLGY